MQTSGACCGFHGFFTTQNEAITCWDNMAIQTWRSYAYNLSLYPSLGIIASWLEIGNRDFFRKRF